MSVQLSMFSPPTLPDTDKCIASPDSAAGPTRSGSPDGLMIDPSGPEAAPASRSAWPGKAAAPMIRATFGLRGSGSSASASLQSSLVSKLQQQLPTDGSILWRMTWKVKATPSGRCVSRLQASARGISGSGCGSWPSPKMSDDNHDRQILEATAREWDRPNASRSSLPLVAKILASWRSPTAQNGEFGASDGLRRLAQGHILNLQDQVTLAGWPTPNAGPQNDQDTRWEQRREAVKAKGINGNGFKLTVGMAATLSPWPTARAEDSESTGAHHGTPDTLTRAARLTGWATASARDWKDTPGMAETATNPDGSVRIRLDQLPRQAALIGPLSPGSTAATTSAGRFRLNPLFSLWLMGYPPHAWASCAVRAMLSSRTSLRK